MTDDTHHPDDAENQPDDHQQAIVACEHAADALRGGDLFAPGRCSMKRARPSYAPSTTTWVKPTARPRSTATSDYARLIAD